jgi:bacterioferritin-associated ferredoxin
MYICLCNAVTERDIHAAAELGARSLDELSSALGVATCCGCCAESARGVLEQALGRATTGSCGDD